MLGGILFLWCATDFLLRGALLLWSDLSATVLALRPNCLRGVLGCMTRMSCFVGMGWRVVPRCYDSDTFHFFSSCDSFTLHVPSPMTHSGLTNHDSLLTGTFHMTSFLTSL